MKKEWKLLLGTISFFLLVFIIFHYDLQFLLFFRNLQNSLLTEILLGLTFLSSIIIIFFFLTTMFLWQENKRRWIFPLWLSLLFSVTISYILKILIARPRPFIAYEITPLIFKASYLNWNQSFPSFHSMLVFSALPLLNKEFPRLKYAWIIFAVVIASARVYFGVHFLSDVLMGGLIGYGIGFSMVKVEEKYSFGKKIVKKLTNCYIP